MSQTQQTAQIPVIDLSGGQSEAEVGKALVDAASTYGFVYVKNEGKDIPIAAVDRMFDLVKLLYKFYILSTAVLYIFNIFEYLRCLSNIVDA